MGNIKKGEDNCMIAKILFGIFFVGIVLLLAAYYVYRITFYADRRKIDDPYRESTVNPKLKINRERIVQLTTEICETPHEDVHVRSFDGLTLRGRFYPSSTPDAPITLLMHGYRSLGARDFCGTFRIFREMGHHILMVDERAHGASEGHTITFGVYERHDCRTWVDYLLERFGKSANVLLVGFSMGAATVLMASSSLPENVRGIIADSGYTSPEAIIGKVARDRRLPELPIRLLARLGAYLFGHFGLNNSTAEAEVEKCKTPILLLHGEGDYFVPSGMSRTIFSRIADRTKKQIAVFPNDGHCASYIFHTERYTEIVENFCRQVLAQGGSV